LQVLHDLIEGLRLADQPALAVIHFQHRQRGKVLVVFQPLGNNIVANPLGQVDDTLQQLPGLAIIFQIFDKCLVNL